MIETEKKRTFSRRSEEGTLAGERHYHAHFIQTRDWVRIKESELPVKTMKSSIQYQLKTLTMTLLEIWVIMVSNVKVEGIDLHSKFRRKLIVILILCYGF